jgi:hypothetical protein
MIRIEIGQLRLKMALSVMVEVSYERQKGPRCLDVLAETELTEMAITAQTIFLLILILMCAFFFVLMMS